MMKHIGLYNAQHITIVLHQMPNEEHMCLVLVDQKVPPRYYQAVQNVLNSTAGQEAKDLATALEGVTLDDNRNLARVLYTEGHLKKVPCNQVFATPYGFQNSNKMKLNDLNEYLKKIEEGSDAAKKMKELDENKGLHSKTKSSQSLVSPQPEQNKNQKMLVDPVAFAPVVADHEVERVKQLANISPQQASDDLKAQGENLRSVACQLLQQAKILAEKAELLYPTLAKRKAGRPIGTGLKLKTVKK